MHEICVIDTETLDIRERSMILSIGIIIADVESKTLSLSKLVDSGINIKLDIMDQKKNYKRTFSQDTFDWWKKQGNTAKKIFKPNPEIDVKLVDLPAVINEYVKNMGLKSLLDIDIYQRGYIRGFDLSKIESVYLDDLGLESPFNRYKCFDIPSVFHHLGYGDTHCGIEDYTLPGFIPHNSLHDACVEVLRLHKVFKGVGLI